MQYSVTTPKGIVVRVKWNGRNFEIVAFPKDSVLIEWACTLDYAAHRFNWLIAKYS